MSRSLLAAVPKLPTGTTRSPPAFKLDATFNGFLFATVCHDRNEMPLSVISALARLDLDPWAEAADLAGMSAEDAARRLSSLLARVVGVSPTELDRAAIATRLVALLPAAISDHGPMARILADRRKKAAGIIWLIFIAMLMTSLMMTSLAPGHTASQPNASSPAARR